jgi:hypothetical protein
VFFERESWLAADKGIGILTLTVDHESGESRVVYDVVTTKKKKVTYPGGEGRLYFVLEYDCYLIN